MARLPGPIAGAGLPDLILAAAACSAGGDGGRPLELVGLGFNKQIVGADEQVRGRGRSAEKGTDVIVQKMRIDRVRNQGLTIHQPEKISHSNPPPKGGGDTNKTLALHSRCGGRGPKPVCTVIVKKRTSIDSLSARGPIMFGMAARYRDRFRFNDGTRVGVGRYEF